MRASSILISGWFSLRTTAALFVTGLLLGSLVGTLIGAPVTAQPEAPAAAPAAAPGAAPQPQAFADIPITVRLNSDSFDYSPRYPEPYFLDFNQITTTLPGGWAKVPQGGPDFAIIFRYPQVGVTWKPISSTYNPALPIALNVTVNGVNETGKIFHFQVDIDLNNDGVNETFISFPTYTTTKTLEPEYINLAGTLEPLSSTANMVDARIYLKVWRDDTVSENPWGIARVYTGYVRQSSLTIPWINPSPAANIAQPDNSQVYYTGTPIVFSAYGSSDPTEFLDDLLAKWSFGDNQTRFEGADKNVSHTYTTPGCYDTFLNITNSLGFYDQRSRTICVLYRNVPPAVSATLVYKGDPAVGTFNGFAGVPYNFSAIFDDADNGKANVTISWNFDDGSPILIDQTNVTHQFNTTGTYDVRLAGSDGTDTVVSHLMLFIANNQLPRILTDVATRVNRGDYVFFSAVGTFDPDGFPIQSIVWRFGDPFCVDQGQTDPNQGGGPGNQANPCEAVGSTAQHKYEVGGRYTWRVIVNDGIATNETTRVIEVNQQPLAVCPAPMLNETSRELTFDGTFSRDPDGNPLLYKWKFGDGFETNYSAVPTATHTYSVPKPEGYLATLIVNDGLWTHSCSFVVRIELLNLPPTAIIWCSASTMWVGDQLRCSANQSTDEFELTYSWDFDASDGVSYVDDFKKDVVTAYSQEGQYTITLQVKDNKGKIDEVTLNVNVKKNPGYCNQVFDMSPFLVQTSRSPPDQTEGNFDTQSGSFAGNQSGVRKGCWVAYSVDMKEGDKVFLDVTIQEAYEGRSVDILAFEVANFFKYKDNPSPVLPPGSLLSTECFKVGERGSFHCELTATRTGTIYFVLDNKDLPVLSPTEGPVAYRVQSKMLWPTEGLVPASLVPFLIVGAIVAVGMVAAIIFISRRQETNY